MKIAPKINFFAGFFEKRAEKNVPPPIGAVHFRCLKILNKIRAILAEFPYGRRRITCRCVEDERRK